MKQVRWLVTQLLTYKKMAFLRGTLFHLRVRFGPFAWTRYLVWMCLTVWMAGCAFNPKPHQGTTAPDLRPAVWQHWQPHEFPGKRPTRYEFMDQAGQTVVLASADSSMSVLRNKLRVQPEDLRQLQFSWRVPNLIEQANLSQRDKADSPVRLVLAFEGDRSTFSMKNAMLSELSQALTGEPMPYATLMYVWCNTRAVGTVLPDPNTDRIRKIVVASGPAQLNQWLKFERNVHADFLQAFQEPPGALLSLALMTDTDNTRTKARAYYGPVVWVGP